MSTQLTNNVVYDANGRLVPQALVTVDDAVNPVFSTIQITGLTASTALVSDGTMHVISSSTTATELGYVHGVTSAIQTQINGLLPLTGGTLTGNVVIAKAATDSTITLGSGVNPAALIGDTSSDLKFQMNKAGSIIAFLPSSSGSATWFQPDGSWTINSITDVPSAILTAVSTTRGFLPPVMTNTQRDAISSPAEGLTVYSTTDHALEFYNGSAWKQVATV